MRLSPTTCYYLRKLLNQSLRKREDVTVSQWGESVDRLANLPEVLQCLYTSEVEISTATQKLENLVLLHQGIARQTFLYTDRAQELIKLEKQILWLLGFQNAE